MNRTEILNAFSSQFADQIKILEGSPESWPDANIVVSMDERGGDRGGKSFLSQADYFEAMRECDFVLSPPGWCMPISHNLIEAMFCAAIPITNGGGYMAEPLKDGKTCLGFSDAEGLVVVIEEALKMDQDKIHMMRSAGLVYYDRFLDPKPFGEKLSDSNCGGILVNAEENSVPSAFSRKF
jgi:glycosyltransferase involved in cell wall biosynthesis